MIECYFMVFSWLCLSGFDSFGKVEMLCVIFWLFLSLEFLDDFFEFCGLYLIWCLWYLFYVRLKVRGYIDDLEENYLFIKYKWDG